MRQRKFSVKKKGDLFRIMDEDDFADPFVQAVIFVENDIGSLETSIESSNLRFISRDGISRMGDFTVLGDNIGFSSMGLFGCKFSKSDRVCSHKTFFEEVNFSKSRMINLYYSTVTGNTFKDCSDIGFYKTNFYDSYATMPNKNIYIENCDNIDIKGSAIKSKNGDGYAYGIYLSHCSGINIVNTLIKDSKNTGLHLDMSNNINVKDSDFHSNGLDNNHGKAIGITHIDRGMESGLDTPYITLEKVNFRNNKDIIHEDLLESDLVKLNNSPQVILGNI